jgi:hypothetical protein
MQVRMTLYATVAICSVETPHRRFSPLLRCSKSDGNRPPLELSLGLWKLAGYFVATFI